MTPDKIAEMLAALPKDDTYAGFPRKGSIYTADLRALLTELSSSREQIQNLTRERDEAQEALAVLRGQFDYATKSNTVNFDRALAAEAQLARQGEALKRANQALVAWVDAAEQLADRPGMDSHFNDTADETLDAVEAARRDSQ